MDVRDEIYQRDRDMPEPKNWYWGRDYGQDLLADINAMAHWRGTTALTRDILQRAFSEISRLRRTEGPDTNGDRT